MVLLSCSSRRSVVSQTVWAIQWWLFPLICDRYFIFLLHLMLYRCFVRHEWQEEGIRKIRRVVLALLVRVYMYLHRIIWDYRTFCHAKPLGCNVPEGPKAQTLHAKHWQCTPPTHTHTYTRTHRHYNLYPQPIPHLCECRLWLNGLAKGFLIDCFVWGKLWVTGVSHKGDMGGGGERNWVTEWEWLIEKLTERRISVCCTTDS